MPSEDLAKSAREYADVLERDMALRENVMGGSFWSASESAESKVRARAVAALGFFDQFAGREAQWAMRAHQMYEKQGDTVAQAARNLASLLREWSDAVEAGLFTPRQIETQATRAVASTDLMTQVRVLVEDRTVHPAAPIVLAGAALEVALRSAVDELQLTLSEKPGISAYARRLRTESILSVQDVKDVDQMAGLRNSAAHGQFDDLSRERAGTAGKPLLGSTVCVARRTLGNYGLTSSRTGSVK